MYESPITAMISDITTEMQQEQDRKIMNAILSVGISVDKDELVKALNYDRQQYGKGYAEGYAAAQANKSRWISVEERLPKMYHQVLCYGANGILIDYYSGETSVLGRPLFMVSEARVSHWMPLPEPPKEVE